MKKKRIPAVTVVLLGIVLCAGIFVIGRHCSDDVVHHASPVEIQTPYIALQFPGTYADKLRHTEIEEDNVIIEIFSMISGGTETELFRICFGDTQEGTVEGYMHLDSGVVPVVVSVFNANVDEFENEEVRIQYYAMMDGLGTVLASIYEDERFSKDSIDAQKENMVQTEYWTFLMYENMMCEEITENGFYKVTFGFSYEEEQYPLYTLYMGDGTRGTPFGNYQLGEEQKILSIEISETVQQEDFPDHIKDNIYTLMETINDVMDVIASNEYFSQLETEE